MHIEPPIAIMGGSGCELLPAARVDEHRHVSTPWGECSASVTVAHYAAANSKDVPLLFLPRHGNGHTIAPHEVNYRANLYALHELGARHIVAINAVGGISASMQTGCLVLPDQIIDYTWGRSGSFWQADSKTVPHIDFTTPYCHTLRDALLRAGTRAGLNIIDGGVYGVTQGPRLETAAEIMRMERDGCGLVGMTGMPEAALARELGCSYACCALVANAAAGKSPEPLTTERIRGNVEQGITQVYRMLEALLRDISGQTT